MPLSRQEAEHLIVSESKQLKRRVEWLMGWRSNETIWANACRIGIAPHTAYNLSYQYDLKYQKSEIGRNARKKWRKKTSFVFKYYDRKVARVKAENGAEVGAEACIDKPGQDSAGGNSDSC